jgi:hypothetical protein
MPKLTPEQVAEAVKLYEAGMSTKTLGELYGIAQQSMWELLDRRITLRPSGAQNGADNIFYRGGKTAVRAVHEKTSRAIVRGDLIPQDCEVCGAAAYGDNHRRRSHAHHDDYSKPMEVRWLCPKCHHDWHRDHTAAPAA